MQEDNSPIKIRFEDIGIVDGVHVVEVYNADTGELIGKNESFVDNGNNP